MALVLLDLIGPSRSHAGFGSRRGMLSPSHDRVRSETRNKPASPTRPICSLSLGFLGAINFPPRLRVILCSGKRTYFTILAVPFVSAVPLQTFHGETWSLLLSCARRRNAAAGVYLPARSFGGRPPSVSAASIAPSRAQLHNSLGDGNAPQGGMEVVLIPLPDAAPTPDPALDPEPALVPDLALDPENAVLDP